MLTQNISQKLRTLILASAALTIAGAASANETEGTTLRLKKNQNPANGFVFATLSMENGPVRADAKSLTLKADRQALAELIEKEAEPLRQQVGDAFYYERRGFANPALIVQLSYDGQKETSVRIPLNVDQDLVQRIEVSGFLISLNASLEGESDQYKCFNPETCVKVRTSPNRIFVSHESSVQIQLYDDLVSCDGGKAIVARRISDPKKQQVRVQGVDLGWLGIGSQLNGEGDAAPTAEAFAGFSEVLASFPEGDTVRKAHVFRDFGGLKIKVDTEAHYFCHYRSHSGESFTTRYTKIGRSCAGLNFYYFSHTTGGADQAYSREYFFQGCRNL